MANNYKPFEVIECRPTGPIHRVVVGLHGYGDNASHFKNVAKYINCANTLYLFLQAFYPAPLADGRQWFEVRKSPYDQFQKTLKNLEEFLQQVIVQEGVPAQKIFLMGFSQGAFLSFYAGCTLPLPLGGVLALSGFLMHMHVFVNTTFIPGKKDMPIFIGQGLYDDIVWPFWHYEMLDVLKFLNFSRITSKMYPCDHTIPLDAMKDMKTFLEEIR